MKRLALTKRSADGHNETADLLGSHVHICSENNFPTAAGLASSAAGYACLGESCSEATLVKQTLMCSLLLETCKQTLGPAI